MYSRKYTNSWILNTYSKTSTRANIFANQQKQIIEIKIILPNNNEMAEYVFNMIL